MEATLADGGVMLSSTVVGGRNAQRFVVQNHRTDEMEVRRSIQILESLADGLRATAGGGDPGG